MKITKRVVDTAVYQGEGGGRCVYWDAHLVGFGLRVYPTGKKSFVLSYRVEGRKHLMTLGSAAVISPDQARDKALRFLGQVLDGKDPMAARAIASERATFAVLAEAYVERHAKLKKKSWDQDRRRINHWLLPAWKNLPAVSIRQAEVANLHNEIGADAPYEANRVLALISTIFECAKKFGLVEPSHPNPAYGIEKFKEKSRDRFLNEDELPRLRDALLLEPNPYVRAAICLYLLTGVRKQELLTARWDEIDLTRGEMRIPDTKANRIHHVPLSPPAVALLAKLPRGFENPYVFPGGKQGHHLVNISKPWLRIRKAAAIEDVRLHDLRRTVGSMLASGGHGLPLIGAVLNHSNASTTKVYARIADDKARRALDAHSQDIVRLMGDGMGHADFSE